MQDAMLGNRKMSHGGDLEWAAWGGHNSGAQPYSLPSQIRVRNCGYIPPPDPGPAHVADHEHMRADDDGMAHAD
jgi:hypothetical protein